MATKFDALAFALQGPFMPHAEVLVRAAAFEGYLEGKKTVSQMIDEVTSHTSTQAQHTQAAPTEQPAPAPQPAAPAGKTATSDECNKAFAAHAQKGGGRSAKTARDAIVKVIPHFSSFKALTPEECAKAVEAMEAA